MINIKSEILIQRLDAFIRKYYLNKIIKGTILSATILATVYLSIVFLEYYGHFSISARTVLFFTGLSSFIAIISFMVINPLLKLFRIGKTISHKQAGIILGKHFPQVQDKLQNTLELTEIANENNEANDLIIASINQRTEQLKSIPFVKAVNLNKNLKYFKYFIPVGLIFAAIFTFWPFILTEGTQRVINYRTFYEKPPPFKFKLVNDTLTVRRGDDFTLKVKTKGRYVPNQVMLNYRGTGFYMQQTRPGLFEYTLKNINNNLDFHFSALDITSEEFYINVLPPPIIIDFKVDINPPAYTGIDRSTVNNTGDISVPNGSVVNWSFNTANIDNLSMVFDTASKVTEKKEAEFGFRKQIFNNHTYSILVENEHFKEQTGIKYHINVIPDLHPSISVSHVVDSSDLSIYYFSGTIDDDYGFKSLTFNYKPGENSDTTISVNLQFSPNVTSQSFYYAFDFSSIDIDGSVVSYYFEVGDNDAINGSKKTRTDIREFVIPSLRDLETESERIMESINTQVSDANRLADQIRRDMDRLQKELIDDQLSDWERAQNIQDLLDKQKQLEEMVQGLSEEQQKLMQQQEQWTDNQDMVDKHQQIQELMENLIDDEMRELLKKLEELTKQFDMSDFLDLMKDMDQNTTNIEQQMERTLELLKRMDVEQRLQNTIKKLEDLAEKQKDLAQETKDSESISDEIKEQQDELKQEFDNIKEDFDKALEKNQELRSPFDLDDFSQDYQDISDGMEQTMDKLDSDSPEGASDSQMDNAQKMQELSDKLQQMLDSQMMAQTMENMQNLRQILDNLLTFSFEQEEILTNQRNINTRDPRYREYLVRQSRARNNFQIVRDSLTALGTRVPELNSVITREQTEIVRLLEEVIDEMSESRPRTRNVTASQQLIMTGANNLALLLSEVMEQMQEQMMMQMAGSGGECENAQGMGEGEMGQMRDLMEGLKQQLEDFIQQLEENGMQPGEGSSEELARMLMQQEMMQKMLNDMMTGGISPETSKILQEINRMIEENITDLINRNISPEMLERKEEIMVRLLEAENSEREREIDEKRESEEARDYKISHPDKAFKEEEERHRFNELLQISNIKLNKFYRDKYKEYLRKLGNEQAPTQ